MEMIMRGDVDVSPVISEVVSVEGTPDAFAQPSGGRDTLSKVLVPPDA